MASRIYTEKYTNVYKFMDTIISRPNNNKFGKDSHKSGEWYGTETWDIAVNQFNNGIPERAEKLKKSLNAFKANSNISAAKSRPRNYYYGYTPNIPAAIIGLPKSMRQTERIQQKVKAISLVYNAHESCGVSAETLQRSGETVLQLVYALEVRGYRVALDILPFAGRDSGRDFVAIINAKEWRQALDILKLSFPLTSPAMFRRFGFHWAEGLPNVEGGSILGYTIPLKKGELTDTLCRIGYDINKTYCITSKDCKAAEFDPLKVAKDLGIIL